MIIRNKLALSACAAAALVFTAIAAQAQLAPPAPKAQPVTPAAPAAKAPPATTAPPAAAAKVAPAKKVAAPASACQGLDEKACTGKATECRWIAAVKRKDGKETSAYCRSLPKSTKASPKKVEAKGTAATPATPAVPGTTRAVPATPAAKAPPAASK